MKGVGKIFALTVNVLSDNVAGVIVKTQFPDIGLIVGCDVCQLQLFERGKYAWVLFSSST